MCRLLRGDVPPSAVDEPALQAAWDYATVASVDEWLAQQIVDAGPSVAPGVRAQAETRLQEAHARELLRADALRRLTAAFASAGVPMLLMKGAGLAYTLYPSPHLRPSDDIDILIAADSLPAADAVLAGAGYVREIEPDAALASTQRHYVRSEGGPEQVVDLHWAIANRHAVAGVIAFADAWAASTGVPGFGEARTLGRVDALLLACVHLVAHHAGSPSLLWLWDVHLLAASLDADGAGAVTARAERARVAAIVAHTLRRSQSLFATPFDRSLLERLEAVTGEPSARLIDGGRRQVDWLRSDLGAVGSVGGRLQLLREHLFPPRAYMRTKYAGWPGMLLPLAYVHRALRGAPGWFRRM